MTWGSSQDRCATREESRMSAPRFATCLLAARLGLAAPAHAAGRTLTFEERVRAQDAIARVYYSHVIGATKPFEEAVPRWVIEKQVLEYLEQSRAWETRHQKAVTASMLDGEWESME